jgi:hypothetical protein
MRAGDNRDMQGAIEHKDLNGRWSGYRKELLQRRTIIRVLHRIPVRLCFFYQSDPRYASQPRSQPSEGMPRERKEIDINGDFGHMWQHSTIRASERARRVAQCPH